MAVLKAKGIQRGDTTIVLVVASECIKTKVIKVEHTDIYPSYCHAYMVNIFFILLIKYLRHRHLQTAVACPIKSLATVCMHINAAAHTS